MRVASEADWLSRMSSRSAKVTIFWYDDIRDGRRVLSALLLASLPQCEAHSNFSSRSLGIAISCAGFRRLLADSSSVDTFMRFRQASKFGSDMNTLSAPSSRITG